MYCICTCIQYVYVYVYVCVYMYMHVYVMYRLVDTMAPAIVALASLTFRKTMQSAIT